MDLTGEVARLLHPGKDLRMLKEHLVHSRRATLRVAYDVGVRKSSPMLRSEAARTPASVIHRVYPRGRPGRVSQLRAVAFQAPSQRKTLRRDRAVVGRYGPCTNWAHEGSVDAKRKTPVGEMTGQRLGPNMLSASAHTCIAASAGHTSFGDSSLAPNHPYCACTVSTCRQGDIIGSWR